MIHNKVDKKEVKKEAKQLLKQGSTKQETFNKLKEKYKYSKEIADIVKYIPSEKAKKKYSMWNYILLAILIITTTLYMITAPSIGIILWYGLLIYAVARMLIKYYMWVTVFSALGLIGVIIGVATTGAIILWTNAIIFLILIIPSLIIPIWISKKFCPPPKEKKEMYIDIAGQKRLRIVYEFMD